MVLPASKQNDDIAKDETERVTDINGPSKFSNDRWGIRWISHSVGELVKSDPLGSLCEVVWL